MTATYKPEFICQRISIPRDERTPCEVLCDNHCWFAKDVFLFGPKDALTLYVQDSGGSPPEHHDGECVQCRKRWLWPGTTGDDADNALRYAAHLATLVQKRGEE